MTRRTVLRAGATATALLTPLGPAAHAVDRGSPWPTTLPLPDGFQPEGIAIGAAPYAYFGSLSGGDIYRSELATGRGRVISTGPGAGHQSVGLKLDSRERLFIAGGYGREVRVVDVRDGRPLRAWPVGDSTTMANDLVLTPHAAYVTDSSNPCLFVLPLGPNGELPGEPRTLPLSGEWVQHPDGGATGYGIERTPDGQALLVVNAWAGALFRVDPATGHARRVPHTGPALVNGDGLLLLGRTLYVVQQAQNAVDVLRIDEGGTRAEAVARITDARFRIPTTAAAYGRRVYLPNARFDVQPTPSTAYEAVAVRAVSP
ncbi:NHL repeat-containing protein [Streptomyces luteolus]|uniref:Superoxide dismutase n=1 Tax=Streptomyces luteolus TaxID=3043615 RepID=A0ABT6T720_9ACTN|nr:superoxide dismutase [Streptomyces sp. B-S-A12]MDI3423614.1 superoxide dismutase [Streptomyces sp. B-S-A12]